MHIGEVLGIIGGVCLVAFAIFITFHMMSVISAEEEIEIMEVNISSIKITDNNIYLLYDGEEIEIKDSIDLTKNSSVYVKLTRDKPYFLYGGSDWSIDVILKTP